MNKRLILTALASAVLMAGCEFQPSPQPNGGDSIEDLNMEYVVRQKRSPKRGLSGHPQLETDLTLIAPGVGWIYNWGATVPFPAVMQQNNMLFLPMAWNANFGAQQMRDYKAANPQAEYILAYNEPNLTDIYIAHSNSNGSVCESDNCTFLNCFFGHLPCDTLFVECTEDYTSFSF